MTGTSPGPDNGPGSTPAPDHDTTRHQEARELRRQHPRWVVIWLARTGRYQACPLYTQRPVILTAEQPGDLAAQMEQAEQAARKGPRARPPGTAT